MLTFYLHTQQKGWDTRECLPTTLLIRLKSPKNTSGCNSPLLAGKLQPEYYINKPLRLTNFLQSQPARLLITATSEVLVNCHTTI